MTEPRHFVSTERYDVDMAVALGLKVVADCGTRFVPRMESLALTLPKCPACHEGLEPTSKPRGKPRIPIEQRRDLPHYVYRCYDSRDRLLYVGCTYNPPARMRQHKAERKAWATRVARTRLVVFPNRRKALDMERLAIETEAPIHNKQFNRESA